MSNVVKIDLTIDEIQILLVALHPQERIEEADLREALALSAKAGEERRYAARQALDAIRCARRKLRDAKTEYEAAIVTPVVTPVVR